jgi:hypothetical protein
VGSVGNFDKTLTIDEHGHVLPSGTLDVDEGFVVQKFYIWVYQLRINDRGADEGAVAAGFQDKDNLTTTFLDANNRMVPRKEWKSRSDVVIDGVFKEGAAIGMVLAFVEETVTKTSKVRWWSETIRLVKA